MTRLRLLLLLAGLLVLAACSIELATPTPTAPLDMPNPASAFCEARGFTLEMREEAGGTVGYCRFPDGSECEEWAYYRGDCEPGGASSVALPNPASAFCEARGFTLEMREEAGGTVGYCRFPDGSECEEWAYYRGECEPGN